MKVKIKYVDGLTRQKQPIEKTAIFNRTFGVEETFKKETGYEYNAQIGLLASKMVKLEQHRDDPKVISEYTSLEFSDTRHQILRFSYAEVNENGVLIQNEDTRDAYDKLVEDEKIDEKLAFGTFFQGI